MTRTSAPRRGTAVALVTMAVAGGLSLSAPIAQAAPPVAHSTTQPAVARNATPVGSVEQLADLPYQALFAAGVQVYEFATIYKQTSPAPTVYYTVLRRLHNAHEGTPGSKRYGFLGFGPGVTLPEVFGMYPRSTPSTTISYSYTFPFDPRTMTPIPQGRQQCITAPSVGPIGPLTGGGSWVRSVCPG